MRREFSKKMTEQLVNQNGIRGEQRIQEEKTFDNNHPEPANDVELSVRQWNPEKDESQTKETERHQSGAADGSPLTLQKITDQELRYIRHERGKTAAQFCLQRNQMLQERKKYLSNKFKQASPTQHHYILKHDAPP